MIVCNLCGASVHLQGAKCERCSGRGIVISSPLRLHPHGSPGSDKWANLYTETPPASPLGDSKLKSSPMSPSKVTQNPSTPLVINVLVPDNGQVNLTRVHGCVLDPKLQLPQCECCNTTIQAGHKLYTAPRPGPRGLLSGSTLCRDCFASHFKLGICKLCQVDVLGERDEGFGGLHVRGRGLIWHARCFVCSACAVNVARIEHSVDSSGTPYCLSCALKREDEQEQPSRRISRYVLPNTSRASMPHASTSSIAPNLLQSPDRQAFRAAVAIKARAGVVTQMKQLFEAGSR